MVPADGVVNQADERNSIAENLQESNLGVPDHDGGNDEEDILQNTRQGHDETRSLADLRTSFMLVWSGDHSMAGTSLGRSRAKGTKQASREIAWRGMIRTRNTLLTFSMKAMLAFNTNMVQPVLCRSA